MTVFIPSNTTIPTEKNQTSTTYVDKQLYHADPPIIAPINNLKIDVSNGPPIIFES